MIEAGSMVFGLADLKLIEYFVQSNIAGKIVIALLVVMNCYAMTLMWTKYQELKKAISHNARDEKRLNDLPSIYDYDDALFPGEEVLTLRFVPGLWMQKKQSRRQGSHELRRERHQARFGRSGGSLRGKDVLVGDHSLRSPLPWFAWYRVGVMDAFGTMDSGGAFH